MQQWKEDIINKLNEKAQSERVIFFHDYATKELNINHIKRNDLLDIVNAFLKSNPDYKAYHDVSNPTNSLFCGLILAEKGMYNDENECCFNDI